MFRWSCDALLPNGSKCETRQPLEQLGSLPPGWARVQRSRKAVLADVAVMGQMSPLLDKAREKDADTAEALDAMTAAMLEKHSGITETGVCCPNHELPAIAFASCDHGCGVY